MALTINTNISSIIAQRSLNNATNTLNKSIERMSTGYKINHANDNAAGYSIANQWDTHISSLDIAASNAATGADLLTTAEGTYSLLSEHLQRIRDLTEQAANGTYGSASLKAIHAEIVARLEEISRISANSEFNGIKLMSYADDITDTGLTEDGINLQVGLYSDPHSVINLGIDIFSNASVSGLFNGASITVVTDTAGNTEDITLATALQKANGDTAVNFINTDEGYKAFAAACAGLMVGDDDELVLRGEDCVSANQMLGFIDDAINEISRRVTEIGAAQNRVESAMTAIDVQSQNLVSSLSTLRDTDVAEESSAYIQAQILQQASATLLSTANQTPSIALNLI